jgi:hypothetical protein
MHPSDRETMVVDLSNAHVLGPAARLRTIAVGQPHPRWQPGLPEGTLYTYSEARHEIVLNVAAPRPSENIERGKCALALYTDFPAMQGIVLLHRISAFPWQQCQYHSRLEPEEAWIEPELPQKGQAPLFHVFLTDARDGRIVQMRVFSPGHDFARALHQAIRTERRLPWNPAAYRREGDRLDDPRLPHQVCVTRSLHKAQVRWEGRA